MKIIISPAKKMVIDTDSLMPKDMPKYIGEALNIVSYLKSLSYEELKKIWKCNDTIAKLNYERVQSMDLHSNLTPAILSYEGIQYQYMAVGVFDSSSYDYIQKHLRILSGLYGVLKPFDGVTPYRLEMQAKINMVDNSRVVTNLYDYWGDKLYSSLEDEVIINLASKEYSRCIEKYITEENKFITCSFGEMNEGKFIEKGTKVKMARGEMVKFMAENRIKNADELKQFKGLNYCYCAEISSPTRFVFVENP